MSSDDLIDIAKRGFALPLLSVLGSILTNVLMQLMIIPEKLPQPIGSKFEIPGYATNVVLFGIIMFLMAIGEYFEDFTNGVEYPKHAVIYGVCALAGLIFFWNSISGINQWGIGQDAIISSIITIILTFGGATVSYYYFRR